MNVLQHMNQPAGLCYGSLPLFDKNCILAAQAPKAPGPRPDSHSTDYWEELELPEGPSILNEDIEMNEPDIALIPSGDPPTFQPSQPGSRQLHLGQYVETFKECGETFAGGGTFMDEFWDDQYVAQRQENVFYPWVLKQEWAFASWLLHSCLSMAAIDSLLLLDIVSSYVHWLKSFSDPLQIKGALLSFCSAKELRTQAKILPLGPKWVCKTLRPEYPVKQLHLFYCNPIECLQSLLSHPLFTNHISFIPRKVWTCAVKLCQVYDEWLSGDCAWSIQVSLLIYLHYCELK